MGFVYKISNSIDSRVYIGSSININSRWNEHKKKLIKGTHENIHLQRFTDKYGIETLTFDIIEEVEDSNILFREQYFIDTTENKFNIATNSSAPMMGKTHSEEALKKISIRNTGINNPMYGRHHSEEVKERIRFKNYGKIPPNKGIPRLEETLIKISNGTKEGMRKSKKWQDYCDDHIITDETRKKISDTSKVNESHKGKNNAMYGKHHSEETKEKIRRKKLGKPLSHATVFKMCEKHKCMYCDIITNKSNLTRYHNDNCKKKPSI